MDSAIEQADCTDCENTDDEQIEIVARDASISDDPDDAPEVSYVASCGECDHETLITVTEEGMEVGDGLTFEDASWNQGDSGDE